LVRIAQHIRQADGDQIVHEEILVQQIALGGLGSVMHFLLLVLFDAFINILVKVYDQELNILSKAFSTTIQPNLAQQLQVGYVIV
jgi:hypothetical protein